MKLRTQILLFFFLFALAPLMTAVVINLPLVLERMELFYHKAHLQNLRADFRDLDQHLASRDEMIRLLTKLPEPGTILQDDQKSAANVDIARAQYINWINQIFQDQLDIVQIVFYDNKGFERFWLDRDKISQHWQPTIQRPERPPENFIRSGLNAERGRVLVGPISLNPEAAETDPRRYMNLRLLSPIYGSDQKLLGGVTIVIDVGGMARYYRNTLWAHDNGSFLKHIGTWAPQGSAFERFPGLQAIFQEKKPALWEGKGEQVMWIPMFPTEKAGALWVGRQVDPSPIARFRNALTFRVLSIVFALIIVIWFIARFIARRADKLSHELTDGIQRVLETEAPVKFNWKGPRELRHLGENLTRLSEEHGRNTRNLRAHARQLEESNRYKSQFLANVSHELRTPLNSILLLSKMLKEDREGNLDKDQQQQVKVIHEAATDLRSLIDNILDLSRIEARKTSFTIESINLPRMLEELQEMMQPQFDAKGIALDLVIEPGTPERIVSDPDKIRQILKNFLSNAVKFTNHGRVQLKLGSIENTPPCSCDLMISVRDSGIGIPKEKQQHIFDAFKQADGATNRRYGGTGLGLTISQQLAHLLGAAIELQSEPGIGSIFSLLLPLEFSDEHVDADQVSLEVTDLQDAPPQDEDSPVNYRGEHILLVGCDMKNLLKLTPILEHYNLRVSAADDLPEAKEVLDEEPPVALAILNAEMPTSELYDTIKAIKGFNQELPVVIAATERGGSWETIAQQEADCIVTLPLDQASLTDILSEHLATNQPKEV